MDLVLATLTDDFAFVTVQLISSSNSLQHNQPRQSKLLEDKVSKHILHAVVEKHYDLRSSDLLASCHDKLDNLIEMGLAGGDMPWIYVVGFESGEV